MTTIDRYIARLYLLNTLTLFVMLFSFVVAVDVALNLDRFMGRCAELGAGQDWSLLRRLLVTSLLVLDLWWPKLLQLFNFMLGLVLVGAMGFTFTQLVRHREFVAILAGGISLRRLMMPMLAVYAVFTLLQVANQELIIPRIAQLLTRDHGDAGMRNFRGFDVELTADTTGRIFLAERFDPETRTLRGLHVWERSADGVALWRVSAPEATWDGGAWILIDPTVQPLATEDVPGSAIAPIRTGLDPTALLMRRYEGLGQSLSWGQLRALSENAPEDAAISDRIRFGRISLVLTNLLGLVIAMPYFLLREPKNMVVQTLKCAPVAVGAVMGGIIGAAAPIPGFPAAFAVFFPVLVMIPVAIAMFGRIKT